MCADVFCLWVWFCQILGVCPFSGCVFFSGVFLDGRHRKVLQQSVCCGLLCRALCAVHVPCPVRPAVLEKPDSVSFSLLLFEQQLWGSWLAPALRYERDVYRLMFCIRALILGLLHVYEVLVWVSSVCYWVFCYFARKSILYTCTWVKDVKKSASKEIYKNDFMSLESTLNVFKRKVKCLLLRFQKFLENKMSIWLKLCYIVIQCNTIFMYKFKQHAYSDLYILKYIKE